MLYSHYIFMSHKTKHMKTGWLYKQSLLAIPMPFKAPVTSAEYLVNVNSALKRYIFVKIQVITITVAFFCIMMSYLLCASQYSRTFDGKNSQESHYKPKDLLEYEVVISYD